MSKYSHINDEYLKTEYVDKQRSSFDLASELKTSETGFVNLTYRFVKEVVGYKQ